MESPSTMSNNYTYKVMGIVAFTLGILGSLHCIGMCGPLAIAFSDQKSSNAYQRFWEGLSYNLGRTVTYSLLGLLFGLLGSFLWVADLQKTLSITLGVFFVLAFLLAYDWEGKLNSSSFLNAQLLRLRSFISNLFTRSKKVPSFILGLANGVLPCGLVYLALAGALASGTLVSGMLFMTFFGLGTLPAMLALVMGVQFVKPSWRRNFRRVLPFVSLCFGIFLIYRGVVVDFPRELDFWEALKNPIMCH